VGTSEVATRLTFSERSPRLTGDSARPQQFRCGRGLVATGRWTVCPRRKKNRCKLALLGRVPHNRRPRDDSAVSSPSSGSDRADAASRPKIRPANLDVCRQLNDSICLFHDPGISRSSKRYPRRKEISYRHFSPVISGCSLIRATATSLLVT